METSRERHIKQIVESGKRTIPNATKRPAANNTTARRSVRPAVQSPNPTERPAARRATSAATRPTTKRVVRQTAPATSAKTAPRSKKVEKIAPKKNKTVNSEDNNDSKSKISIWIAIILLFISGLLLLSCLSYLKYWKADQSLASISGILDNQNVMVYNAAGRLGAIIADTLIRKWFGIFAVLTPLLTLFAALKIVRYGKRTLYRSLRFTTIFILVGSLALGHFAGANPEIFGSGYGGDIGINVAAWIQNLIGEQGTSLFIVLLAVSVVYYVNAGWLYKTYKAINNIIFNYKENIRTKRTLERLKLEKLAIEMQLSRAALQKQELQNVTPRATAANAIVNNVTAESNDNPEELNSQNADQTNENKSELEAEPIEAQTLEQKAEVPQETPTEQLIEQHSELQSEQPKPTLIQPKSNRSQYTIIKLDNNQDAVVTAFDEEQNPISFLYLDAQTLKTIVQPVISPKQIDEDELFATDEEDGTMEITHNVNESSVDTIESSDNKDTMNVVDLEQVTEMNAVSDIQSQPEKIEPRDGVKMLEATNDNEPALLVEDMREEEAVDNNAINSAQLYDPTLELRNYRKPPVELLRDHTTKVTVTDEELLENKNRILTTLNNFGIKIDSIEATIGPTVTLYEIVPSPGVRISKIKNLEDDIALSLAALGIRIIAPIPGKGTIGIEVPNKDKETVSMYSVIKSAKFYDFKGDLPIALGKTIQNETFVFDLAKMPHLLVAGATGQGKSVGLNAIITSLLYKKHPSELKFILIDPKKVELTLYSKLEKHFLAKMPDSEEAIITDTQKVIYTLNSVCVEMDARYDLLKDAGMRSIKEYNAKFVNRKLNPLKGHRFLPYFVVIIDEFADLIMTAGREVETPIARIAQLARAVGIHLIIATQRPTTNIITGVIKANFPARIAFRVTSQIDSRTILDSTGANQLIGRGDLLISTGSDITRVQCAFVDTPEVELIAEHIERQQSYSGAYELPDYQPEGDTTKPKENSGKRDPLFNEIAEIGRAHV